MRSRCVRRWTRLPAVAVVIALSGWLAICAKTVAGDGPEAIAWSSLRGRITVSGELPEIENERIPPGQAICIAGGLGMPDDNLKISPDRGLADVFVILQATAPDASLPIHPDLVAASSEPARIQFFNCRIRPHAIIVRCGQPIEILNRDPVGHLCRIQTLNNEAYLRLMHDSRSEIRFDRVDPVPGTIRCDIHRWMDGVILVRNDPYAVLTDDEGRFQMNRVPAGHWRLSFWHRQAGYLASLETDVAPVDRKGGIEIDVSGARPLDLGRLTFPASEFRKRAEEKP